MRGFADKFGRTWLVSFSDQAKRRVRDRLGLAVDVTSAEFWDKLANDPALRVNLLYVLCENQAETRGVGDVEFGESLADGEVTEAAVRALMLAGIDAAPRRWRDMLRNSFKRIMAEAAAETSPN